MDIHFGRDSLARRHQHIPKQFALTATNGLTCKNYWAETWDPFPNSNRLTKRKIVGWSLVLVDVSYYLSSRPNTQRIFHISHIFNNSFRLVRMREQMLTRFNATSKNQLNASFCLFRIQMQNAASICIIHEMKTFTVASTEFNERFNFAIGFLLSYFYLLRK